METPPPPRVLILTREHVLHWAPLYNSAFRECCDVLTVGPPLNVDVLGSHDWQHAQRWLEPNNIESSADTLAEILPLLPDGWQPDLIVTVQSAGPPIRDIARAACPTVYISVDTWHDHEEFRHARPYDHVFVAQRALVPHFREAGIPHAEWLPLACSPRHHHPVAQDILHDIVFVGMTIYMVNRQRVARLLRLEEHFRVAMLGALGGDEYCRALSSGTVVFNSSVAQDLNMRIFETMAIGRPLLTNRDADMNGLTELFKEGVHFLGYDDTDLIAQAQTLIADDALRDRMVTAAREEVLAHHTYRHRVETILQRVDCSRGTESLLRDASRLSAWIPRGARCVLDVGLRLDRSKVALKRQGVAQLIGVSLDNAPARAGSYDQVLPWPLDDTVSADTLLCAHPLEAALPLPDLLAVARRVLPAAGELVLVLNPSEATISGLGMDDAAWGDWSYAEGFHLILLHRLADETGVVLRFRRYVRALEDISREIFARFPGGGNHPEVGPA